MYKNGNIRMHGCGQRLKRFMALISVLSMVLTVTGCSGDSQTAGSRLNTENAVDKVLNQKTGGEDAKSTTETGITTETETTTETGISTETEKSTEMEAADVTDSTSEPTYGQVVNGDSSVIAQYKSDGVDVDLTLMGSDLVYATV